MKEQKKVKEVIHMAHKRHQALGIYDNSTHHTDYCFRKFTNYFPVKSEECGDQTWEVLVINVCSSPNKSSDERVLCTKVIPVCPFSAWAKQDLCVKYLYWSPELKIIWAVSPSAGKIHCHSATLLTDVIDCSSYCLYVSLKQLILAQWDRMSCYTWDSQNEWLHGILNYFLFYSHQLIKAGAVLLLSEDTSSFVWRWLQKSQLKCILLWRRFSSWECSLIFCLAFP